MDTYPITARSLGRYFKVDGNNLERAYKEHLSGFRDWDQLKHAGDWILLPENVGGYMSIDESMHGKDLYTFLTNKEGHGGPNSLVAVVKGTTAKEVVARFLAIPEDKRLAVKEVTMDFSNSMFSIVRQAFPNATIVIDCFHIMKLAGEALEAMRLKLKRLAQKEQKKRSGTIARSSQGVQRQEDITIENIRRKEEKDVADQESSAQTKGSCHPGYPTERRRLTC